MNITDAQADRAREVLDRLRDSDVRARLDDRNEKVGKKVREATLEKIPYMLVIGDREVEEGTVSIRDRDGGKDSSSLDEFVERVLREVEERSA
jgi:threonyl-tRNA synthetase